MSKPLSQHDPAFWMLQTGRRLEAEGVTGDLVVGDNWLKEKPIHKDGCYICKDPEFRLMGLPLCKPCELCGEHVPADDIVCDNGHDMEALYYIRKHLAEGGKLNPEDLEYIIPWKGVEDGAP